MMRVQDMDDNGVGEGRRMRRQTRRMGWSGNTMWRSMRRQMRRD